MIDQFSRERCSLRHSAGKMMLIGIGKRFQPDQAHKIIHFFFLLLEYSAGDQTSLNVPAHGQPGKKIWILKNQTALGVWSGDWVGPDQQLARVESLQTGNQAKQRRF